MELFGKELFDQIEAVLGSYRQKRSALRERARGQKTTVADELELATKQLEESRKELERFTSSTQLGSDPELEQDLAAIEEEFNQACEQARKETKERTQPTIEKARKLMSSIDDKIDRLSTVALFYHVEQLGHAPDVPLPRKHDIDELIELARKANDDGHFADVKRALGIDGYYDRAQMATDVLVGRAEMQAYLDQQLESVMGDLDSLRAAAARIEQSLIYDAEDDRREKTLQAQMRSIDRLSAARRVRQWQLEARVKECEARVGELKATDDAERAEIDRQLQSDCAALADSARDQIEALGLQDARISFDQALETFGALDDVIHREWSAAEGADHKIAVLRHHMSLDIPSELKDAFAPLGSLVDTTEGQLDGLCLMDVARPEPLVIRYKNGQRNTALAAARRMVLECTRAVSPSNLEVIVCDPVGAGTSLGQLGPLFAGKGSGAFSLLTTEAQVGNQLRRIVDGLGETGAAIASSSPATVAQYNATHPGNELPHRVLVLFDIDRREYGERALESIVSILRRAADFGITVVMVRQDKPPERNAAREKPLSRIEKLSSVATLLPFGQTGSCRIRLTDGTFTPVGELFCDDAASGEFIAGIKARSRSRRR